MARPNIIAALDIGSSKISTLIAQRAQESQKITVIGAASVPSRGVKKGQIINIEEVTQTVIQSVESAERMAGVSIGKLAVNISSLQIGSLNSQGVVAVANPEGEITPEDVLRVIEAAQAVSLPSTQEILHVLPMNFTVDSQTGIRDPIGMSGVRLEVDTHIITATSTLIRNIAKCVSEIGGQLDQIIYSGLASSESVLTETEKELGVVMVDIGGGTTDVAIFVEGSLAYSAVIPIGAKNITNDLAIGLRVSLESAEKIKVFLSTPTNEPALPSISESESKKTTKEKKKDDIIDFSSLHLKEEVSPVSRKALVEGIIKPRMNEIFDLVTNHIKKSGLGHAIPSGLVITGGGALTVEIVDTARRRLSLPARIGDPIGVSGLIEDISNPAYATTIGLILYAFENQNSAEPSAKWSINAKHAPAMIGGLTGKLMNMLKSLLP